MVSSRQFAQRFGQPRGDPGPVVCLLGQGPRLRRQLARRFTIIQQSAQRRDELIARGLTPMPPGLALQAPRPHVGRHDRQPRRHVVQHLDIGSRAAAHGVEPQS